MMGSFPTAAHPARYASDSGFQETVAIPPIRLRLPWRAEGELKVQLSAETLQLSAVAGQPRLSDSFPLDPPPTDPSHPRPQDCGEDPSAVRPMELRDDSRLDSTSCSRPPSRMPGNRSSRSLAARLQTPGRHRPVTPRGSQIRRITRSRGELSITYPESANYRWIRVRPS